MLAEALIIAGRYGHDDSLAEDGLRLLDWLVRTETHDGHLSPAPVGGWRAPEPRPVFDQQPIEVATLVDACARALALTGDPYWQPPSGAASAGSSATTTPGWRWRTRVPAAASTGWAAPA